ncbi:hypothetical protein NLX83_08545 [Allokutzneria sp. A3M-2-11 16]|uniref:hypothetical protein n=1 Tax=Allokutzneria sp. A3M-2-11 16 TaxID=2962043 RepID=UPI0020B7DBB1|nr:hypothetical protein [Allokutzneria sp. A3M-2-11 16]MCP3799301.1 hypothetical protein [Allokutzneria sp. A3M-2-11 16]
MQIKKKLSAALVTLAAAGGMVLTAPAAQAADACEGNGPGGWMCRHTISGGHKISILFYGDTREMAGWDNGHYYTHIDRSRDGGRTWEGPLATGQGWSGRLNRQDYSWRACSNVNGRYHCTGWH